MAAALDEPGVVVTNNLFSGDLTGWSPGDAVLAGAYALRMDPVPRPNGDQHVVIIRRGQDGRRVVAARRCFQAGPMLPIRRREGPEVIHDVPNLFVCQPTAAGTPRTHRRVRDAI